MYEFGGYNVTSPTWQATNQFEVYDPSTNTWQALASTPERWSEAAVATDGSSIFVAGGYHTTDAGQQIFSDDSVWQYNVASGQWLALPSLPAARAVGAMVDLNGQLHYFGGSDINRNDVTDHWVLDLNQANPQWTVSTPLPVAFNRMGGVVLDGKIYAVGGQTGFDSTGVPESNVYVWDPANPSAWTTAASLPEPHSHIEASTVVVNNQIVVVGGDSSVGTFLDNVDAYDPATNAWTELTPLPLPRLSPAVSAIGDQIIVTGGYDYSGLESTTWESSPLT